MRLAFHGGILCFALVAIAVMVPEETWGRGFHSRRCCKRCRRSADRCVCPVPCLPDPCPPSCAVPAPTCSAPIVQSCAAPCPPVACPPTRSCQTTLRPVTETQYVQRPVVSTRVVKQTCLRQENYMETVPQTVCENVTVDEGCYQMVWVPKVVTRQVPKTVYTQRVATRSVPYTVNRQITECTTQTVPVQRVRYIPETKTVTCVTSITEDPRPTCTAYVPAADPTCAAPGMMGPATGPATRPTPTYQEGNTQVPPPMPAAPMPRTSNPDAGGLNVPAPEAANQGTSYYSRPVAPRSQAGVRPVQNTNLTAIAPSAASVWRTRPAR